MKHPQTIVAAAVLVASILGVAPPATAAPASASAVSASALLGRLQVRSEARLSTYDRSRFGADAPGSGCTLRQTVLVRDAIGARTTSSPCVVTGRWKSLYDRRTTTDSRSLQIVRLVPLAEAWRSGASGWSDLRRAAFRRDTASRWQLQAASPGAALSKHAGDPASWTPDVNRCTYVAAWIGQKYRWHLSVDRAERAALRRQLERCGGVRIVRPSAPDVAALTAGMKASRTPNASTPAGGARPGAGSPSVPGGHTGATAAPTSTPASTPAATSTPDPSPASTPTSTPTPTSAPTSAPASTPPAAAVQCPVGRLYGETISVVATPTAVGTEDYVNLSISGYVVNDSDQTVNLSAIPPKIQFYSASGAATSYAYPSWAVPEAAYAADGQYVVRSGAVARWELTNALVPASRWASTGSLSASPIAPFAARWADAEQVRGCASPLQPVATLPVYSIVR